MGKDLPEYLSRPLRTHRLEKADLDPEIIQKLADIGMVIQDLNNLSEAR